MTDELLPILDLEPLESNLFRGRSFDPGWQRVFGGQVLGQALMAASLTVEDRLAHSMHGYFLRAGDPAAPIVYDVERLRDGGSFSTRRVVAIQHGEPIFSMAASFHVEETGFAHQAAMPDVPPPEALADETAFLDALSHAAPTARIVWTRRRPIEIRPVDMERFVDRGRPSHGQAIWIRPRLPVPDDARLHRAVLAYASDLTLLDTTLLAHGRWPFDGTLQVASLDHAMWFHRPFRFDDWMLHVSDSPAAAGGRGLNRGLLFDRAGTLIASVAQEGLVRPIRPRPDSD